MNKTPEELREMVANAPLLEHIALEQYLVQVMRELRQENAALRERIKELETQIENDAYQRMADQAREEYFRDL